MLRAAKPVDPVRRQLDEYFEGARHDFELPLDLTVSGFYAQVLAELALVPYGETTTYGDARGADGAPERGPRDRHGDAQQPGADRAPLPSRDRLERGASPATAAGSTAKRFLLELERGGTLFARTLRASARRS